jgi:hypothetical protein
MSRRDALALVLVVGAAGGALAIALGYDGFWALLLLAGLLAGLAEVGSG